MHIIKIVGNANGQTWSQVHNFAPQDEKLASHGELVAVLSFKVKTEGVEVTAFGSEIINRLQEIYYSNETESILKKLSQSLESLEGEFLDKIDLQAVIGAVWQKDNQTYLYVTRNGQGQARLKRGETIAALFKEKNFNLETISGKLENGDRLLMNTEGLEKLVTEEEVKTTLSGARIEDGGELLGTVVQGKENNSQAAGALLEVEPSFAPSTSLGASEGQENFKEERVIKVAKAAQFWQWVKARWEKGRAQILLRQNTRSKKSIRSAVLILILIFGLSLFLAGRKKQMETQTKNYQAVLEEVKYKYEEAHGLLTLNPLRAKSLLLDSQAKLKEYETKTDKALKAELKDLSVKIEADLGQAQREYVIESGTEWFDFDITKDDFRGTDWAGEENKLWAWDEASRTVIELDLATKASRMVASGGKIAEGKLVAYTGGRGFVIGQKSVTVVEGKTGTVVTQMAIDGTPNISDSVGFGSNLYLLDKSVNGQIKKYLGVASGLSSERNYLKGTNLDLSEAVSLTIDGSVWALFSDGTVVKYIQGVKESFTALGLDKSFEEPIKIFTSPQEKNLYILDRKQTRVVVLSKTGEYQAQYIWPGMAGAKDMFVSEDLKKMFFLTGEKVFTIDLRN